MLALYKKSNFVRKRQIKYIIALVSFALVGIIIVQLLWINNTVSENEKRFSARVLAMLHRAVQRNERNEMALMYRVRPTITQQYRSNGKPLNQGEADSLMQIFRKKSIEQLKQYSQASPFQGEINQIFDMFDSVQKMMGNRFEQKGRQLQTMSQWMTFEAEIRRLPLKERLQLSQFERILQAEKKNFNIETPMEYAVIPPQQNKPALKSEGFKSSGNSNQYKADIYPNDVYGNSPKLIVSFPDKNRFLVHSIQWLLILSIVFTIIILLAFYMTIRTILQQKKISEIKNDFINNMTHELKTPIATISLATDAMSRTISESASGFTKIIKQESERMHKHVEHILQMARIDKNEFQLSPEKFDITEFVQDVCDNQELRINEKGGILTVQPFNSQIYVNADRDHFANVLYNLIDNAIKYTTQEPQIDIKITKKDGFAFIVVRDKGIGMAKETQKHIFDKFYRASTGNVHNVKGFGLGLSYVKAVMQHHNGDVTVKSELQKGSEFTLKLPVAEPHRNDKTTLEN